MLQGVVSILDPQHCDKVESIWQTLEREFGLRTASASHPHFTYHLVEHYDLKRAKGVVQRFAHAASPFTIRTTGLGIFVSDTPTIYVPVVRSPQLSAFHSKLWTRLSRTAEGIHAHHYDPDHLLPHISLASGDLKREQIPDVIRLLSANTYNWEIRIDNLTLVRDAQAPRETWQRFPLGTQA